MMAGTSMANRIAWRTLMSFSFACSWFMPIQL